MLARHWSERGVRLSVITFDRADDPIYHRLPVATELHRLGARVGTGYLGNLKRTLALRTALTEAKPDVLISFLTKNNLLAALACLGRDTPLICSERNNPQRQAASPIWNLALKLAYRRANRIVCQTDAVRRCFPKAVQDRLVTIHNPIEGFARGDPGDDAKMIGAVGRLTPQKGFGLLIDAFAMIADRYPDWKLTIWGEGESRGELEANIAHLGLSQRVLLPGVTAKPGDWAKNTSLFVQSSLYEGFPNATAEALASGLPVVATNCDFGTAELIESEVDGLLVQNESVSELAQGMARMISDGALRKACEAAAEKSAKRFHPSLILKRWDDLLQAFDQNVPATQRQLVETQSPS